MHHNESSHSVILNCFSPPVMAATFVAEMAMIAYIVWRNKLRTPERISLILILCLAIFQLSEFNICERNPDMNVVWTKIGLVAITMLPALGLHLSSLVTKRYYSTIAAYAAAIATALAFITIPITTSGATCAGNYVIIHTNSFVGTLFGLYYWFFLFLLLVEVVISLTTHVKAKKPTRSGRIILQWLATGYSSFMVPMIIAYLISPVYLSGAPSIMCGFAVILAIILTFKVVPEFQKKKY